MKKGANDVQPDITIDPFSKFLGRIETEVEIYAHHVLGCSPEELTTRLGSALVGSVPQREFDVASVPGVLVGGYSHGPAHVDQRLRKVALGSGSHSHSSSGHFSATAGKPSPHAWRNKNGSLMTAAQRAKEQKKRMKKWSKSTQAKWNNDRGLKVKKATGKKTSPSREAITPRRQRQS